ncbi:MAG: FkbM family methyltransferase [Holosporaceae bacterium]|jgi:FkbM family methyltransferase|nr:FkbM family methyltransferase [Holosporaceae bacterium]
MQFRFSRYVLFCLCLALIADKGFCEDAESSEHSEAVEEEEHSQPESDGENVLPESEEEHATETESDHDDSSVAAEESTHSEKSAVEEDHATKKEDGEAENDHNLAMAAEENDHLEDPNAEEDASSEPEDNEHHDTPNVVEEVESGAAPKATVSNAAASNIDNSAEHTSKPEIDKIDKSKNIEDPVQEPEPSKQTKSDSADLKTKEPSNPPKESLPKSPISKLDRKVNKKVNKAKPEAESPKKQEKRSKKTIRNNANAIRHSDRGNAVDNNGDTDENGECAPVEEECEEVAAPLYNKLVPIRGWNRHSGDSAKTVSQWCRWWEYLRLRKPVLMSWIDGLTLKIYPKNEIGRALFVSGVYDPNSLVVVNALLKDGDVFIDAGASMGYFSLLMANAVGETGHVYALEPSKRDYKRLESNIELNGLSGTVSHYPYALADLKGSATLLVAGEERNALNTLGSEFGVKGVEKTRSETVDTVTLDGFIEEEEISKVDVLKLDVEGSELKALEGARKTITKHKPAIMLGVNAVALKACGADTLRVEKLLSEFGYYMYKLVETPFMLEKIDNIGDARSPVIFCLHSSVKPPKLPQPKRVGIAERIMNFFR